MIGGRRRAKKNDEKRQAHTHNQPLPMKHSSRTTARALPSLIKCQQHIHDQFINIFRTHSIRVHCHRQPNKYIVITINKFLGYCFACSLSSRAHQIFCEFFSSFLLLVRICFACVYSLCRLHRPLGEHFSSLFFCFVDSNHDYWQLFSLSDFLVVVGCLLRRQH